MKKICICATTAGTLETFVVETAKYLYSKDKYDITLICTENEKFENLLPSYIHYIPVHMNRGFDFSAVFSIRRFIQIFRDSNFDMVQYSTPNAACYASIAARICKVPIRLYCQWGIRYVGMSGVNRIIFKRMEKAICKNSTDIRAVSPLNRKFAIEEGLYPCNKAIVVGKGGTIGVDMHLFDINKKSEFRRKIRDFYGINDGNFVFGFVGRISKDKGCEELVQAFKRVADQNDNVRLLVIGPVDPNCGLSEDVLGWLKNSKHVVLTGNIGREKIMEYYCSMDVLVHPTYREGFGMVLQEAGALGIAMITTRIPGASEVMEDEVSCVLVEPKNADELGAAMNRLATDLNFTEMLGHAAYERTKKYYERSIMLENQRRDYISLLNSKRKDTEYEDYINR